MFEFQVAQAKGVTEVERLVDVVGAPAFSDNLVCAAAFQGAVTCVDSTNGQRWSNKTMLYRGLSAPVVFPGAVAVGDEDGYVHFLSPRTGEEMARVRLSGPIVTQAQPFSAGAIFQTSKGDVAYLSNR